MNSDFKERILSALKWFVNNDLKSLITVVTSIVLCIVSIVAVTEIGGIKDDVGKMEKQVSYIQSDVDNIDRNVVNGFNAILDYINESEAEKENLISQKSHEYNRDLFCYVIPKEYNSETTKVVLMRENTEYPMTFKNGVYELVVDAETVSEMENGNGVYFDVIVVTENGKSKTQKIDWWL